MSEWKIYNNGNYRVGIDLTSGTKIRETEDDMFISEFPENIDIKITNQCDMGCPMCHENSYPEGKHGNIMKAKFINTLRPYTELACLDGNTFVYNTNGAIKIKDLKVGDYIFDDSHTLRRIVNISKTNKKAFLMQGSKGFNVICSEDHPFISNSNQIIAKNMIGKTIDCLPIDNSNSEDDVVFDAIGYMNIRDKDKVSSRGGKLKGKLIKISSSGNYFPRYTQINEDLMWLYGLYVAEGSRDGLTLNISETDFAEKAESIWANYFWEFSNIRKNTNHNSINVEFGSKKLIRAIFIDYFKAGHGARNKNIDYLFSINNKSLIRAALIGLFDGDGCYRTRLYKGRQYYCASLKTTSERLAYEVSYIMARHFGIYSYVYHGVSPEREIEGRLLSSSDYYMVDINGDVAVEFFGADKFKGEVTKHNSTYKRPKIKRLVPIDVRDLYDITLDSGSHVFPVNGYFLTHNCGGGNALSHPDLIPFLEKLRSRDIIPNLTVNQVHFMKNKELLKSLVDRRLIFGLGVSLDNATAEFIDSIKEFDNAVIHVINGIVTPGQMEALADNDLKVLILGYKDFRRGESYKKLAQGYIEVNQLNLKGYLKDYVPRFKALSFDNLAIEQLDVKSLMTQEQWDEFYMGDDGQFTMYIDMVTETFAKNSVAALTKRYKILDNIDDMFKHIKGES